MCLISETDIKNVRMIQNCIPALLSDILNDLLQLIIALLLHLRSMKTSPSMRRHYNILKTAEVKLRWRPVSSLLWFISKQLDLVEVIDRDLNLCHIFDPPPHTQHN